MSTRPGTSTAVSVAADLAEIGALLPEAIHRVTKQFTAVLQRQVVANASGKPVAVGPHGPGPNAVTGDYRRSINRLTTKYAAGSIGRVGTNKPQARRLEFGFVGTDALGRTYDQPPYPHFGPALDEVAPLYEAAVALVPGAVATIGRLPDPTGPNAPVSLGDAS